MRKIIILLFLLATISAQAQTTEHVVKRGETYASIANKYGISEEDLLKANPKAKKGMPFASQKLIIPKADNEEKADNTENIVTPVVETPSTNDENNTSASVAEEKAAKQQDKEAKAKAKQQEDETKAKTKQQEEEAKAKAKQQEKEAKAKAKQQEKEVKAKQKAEAKAEAKAKATDTKSAEKSTAKTTTQEVETTSVAKAETAAVTEQPAKSTASMTGTGGLFEGELEYVGFENHNKKTVKNSAGLAYNGVRRTMIMVKGNKVHMIDKSMHLHTILDPDNNIAYFYSDATKKGIKLNCKKYVEKYLCANDVDVQNKNNDNPSLTAYSTFKNTGQKAKYQDYNCDVYDGKKTSSYCEISYTLWSVADIKICDAIRYMTSGLHFKGLPTKYVWDGYMKVPFLGTMNSYVCNELKTVTPKSLADADFLPPTDFEIKEAKSELAIAFKILGVYKANTKYLKKNGMYPTGAEEESEATYKIEDEWDF